MKRETALEAERILWNIEYSQQIADELGMLYDKCVNDGADSGIKAIVFNAFLEMAGRIKIYERELEEL
jgi:hypothetical protein